MRHFRTTSRANSQLQWYGPEALADGRVRCAGIRRRARARRGALVRHSRRSGSTDMQAGLRRCGPLVRHSKTISGWTTKVQVPGPCRSRVGQVGADGIRRRARAGRGALVRHSRRSGSTDTQAGPRRCGSLARHSGTVTGCTIRFQVPGPCRRRAGRVGVGGIRHSWTTRRGRSP